MSATQLTILLARTDVGRVMRDSRGRPAFVYREAWRRSADAFPLSLSIPLGAAEHPHDRIEPFLWGLLPDNDRIIDRWARDFHGRLASPRRLGPVEPRRRPGEDRARAARRALGIPSGRTPTTHIPKPPIPDLAGHVENEHFCLELAREVGLPTARSEVRHFGSEVALVVERYDRVRHRGGVLRIHQEDCCQALCVMPTRKYESQDGPGPRKVVELLRETSSAPLDDVGTFVDALAFSWLAAGTDAHAKNYSLLLASEGRLRLAPPYDLGSMLLYPGLGTRKLELAMKIGSSYLLEQIGRRQWSTLAKEVRMHADEVLGRVRAMAERLPDASVRIAALSRSSGLSAPIIDRLATAIAHHARSCRAALD